MKVLITGGLGFVGTQLSIRLLNEGHEVTVVDHSPAPRPYTPREVLYVSGDTTMKGPWMEKVSLQDAIVNLAGVSIFDRWTEKRKKLIYDSRILTTRNVVEAIPQGQDFVVCSTSAVGYYGARGDEEITEKDGAGNDFLARVCVDWEKEALKAQQKGARVVITRFGIVLGKTGGALGQMIPAFKRFIGGPLGSGNQWLSWIHMEDLLSGIVFVLQKSEMEGPANLCSPRPVRNKDLAKELGHLLHRPSFLKTPGFALRLALGEFANSLLTGQRVLPQVLLKHGFTFKYPVLRDALKEVLEK